MAEVVAISLEVDSGQSVQSVKKLEDAIKDVQKTTNSSNVEEKFNSLNQAIDRGEGSVEDLRKAIKSYQTIALSAGRTSPIGQEALKRSAQLKDKLTDLDNEVKRLAQDGKNLQGAMQIGTGVVAGYQAFTGVTAMLGVENEDLMKTMVKLQASMSVLQAIEQLRLATEKESQAMLLIKNVRTKTLTALNFLYAGSIKVINGALKSFRGALIATGLGALVVLIGTIIAKWDDWKDSIMKIINVAFAPFIKVLQYLGVIESDLEKQRREDAENQVKRLEEQNAMLDEVMSKTTDRLNHDIQMAKARGENTRNLERELLEAESIGAQKRLAIAIKLATAKMRLDKDLTEEQKKEMMEKVKADEKAFSDSIKALQVFDAQTETINKNAQDKKNKDARARSKTAKDKKEKEQDEELRLIQEALEKELSLINELEDAFIQSMQDEDAKKIALLQLQQERELEAVRLKYGAETELEAQLLINQNQALRKVKEEIRLANEEEDKIAQSFFDEQKKVIEIEEIKLSANDEIAILKEKLKHGLILEQEYADGIAKIEKQKEDVRNAGFKTAESIVGSLGSLMEGNEKAQKGVLAVQKAMTLAQIGIDTAKAISSLTAMSAGNPANTVTGGGAGVLQYATGIATILSNVAQAKKLLSGSGSGSISAGGGSRVTAPSFNNQTTTQTGNSGGGGGNGTATGYVPTTKVVLVESELEAMQGRVKQVQQIATI